jgi:hypothetical protein
MPMHDWTRVDAGTYHDFHHSWTAVLKGKLNELLPSGYYAMAELRTDGPIPDVVTLATGVQDQPEMGPSSGELRDEGGVAIAEARPKARLAGTAFNDEYAAKQNRIVVRTSAGKRVVAVVEIVSPGNRGSDWSVRNFVEKCRSLMAKGVHLLIVDPFPPDRRAPEGLHALIFGGSSENTRGPRADRSSSFVSYECREEIRAYLETIAIGEPLPEMPVFLLPREGFVEVPLEETYAATWRATPAEVRGEIEQAGV